MKMVSFKWFNTKPNYLSLTKKKNVFDSAAQLLTDGALLNHSNPHHKSTCSLNAPESLIYSVFQIRIFFVLPRRSSSNRSNRKWRQAITSDFMKNAMVITIESFTNYDITGFYLYHVYYITRLLFCSWFWWSWQISLQFVAGRFLRNNASHSTRYMCIGCNDINLYSITNKNFELVKDRQSFLFLGLVPSICKCIHNSLIWHTFIYLYKDPILGNLKMEK